jgi:glycosyltransferase involved in cell wall biosynthesis
MTDLLAPGVAGTAAPNSRDSRPALLCLSHLRWAFVFQRPQHLLTRATARYDVTYVEEPLFEAGAAPHWRTVASDGIQVATPILPEGLNEAQRHQALEALISQLPAARAPAVAWYYTPLALDFTRHLGADVIVYDNMDELTLFHGADSRIALLEAELLARADIVFTGGHSLYEAKQDRHVNIHPVPSSVDVAHFARDASAPLADPADQAAIPHPRAGFFGVIDERMDMELVAGLAALRPDIQFLMIGPVVKIDPGTCPAAPNIHWLGGKAYAELPAYLHNWDVGLMPFALNDATRFISPTKTPEYLAAGLPVVSTPIRDVVRPYGDRGLVQIAATAQSASAALDDALAIARNPGWRSAVADQLASNSWDRTWAFMLDRIEALAPVTKETAHA